MKGRGIRKARRFYTEGEKKTLLEEFEARKNAGLLSYEAASKLGVPLSTVLRWKLLARDLNLRSQGRSNEHLIQRSFTVLSQMERRSEEENLEALLILVGWLRCSSKPNLLPLSVATLLVAVAKAKFSAVTIDELPIAYKNSIVRHIRLTDFLEFCALNPCEEAPEFPTFWDDLVDDQPYDDRDELARMCWCLLALSNSPEHGPASLNKTMYLMNANVFRYKWNVSRRTRDKLWRTHASAAPFFYTERFHSPLDLSLKPHEPDSLQRVNDLLNAPHAIKEFLQKTRATVEQLCEAMDRRALQAISFPKFPVEIAPFEMQKPMLTPSVIAALRHYKSSEK